MESSLPIFKQKNCSVCGISFTCGATENDQQCWCTKFPPVLALNSDLDCKCPDCLMNLVKEKIDNFINDHDIKSALEKIKKNNCNTSRLLEGIDYYIENGLWVFTKWYHLKRGYCCSNGCRHCPYR